MAEKSNSKDKKHREEKNINKNKVIFNYSKKDNFSNWYTEIVKTAELGDLRYSVKGFLIFQPWSVLCMEKMYNPYVTGLLR